MGNFSLKIHFILQSNITWGYKMQAHKKELKKKKTLVLLFHPFPDENYFPTYFTRL